MAKRYGGWLASVMECRTQDEEVQLTDMGKEALHIIAYLEYRVPESPGHVLRYFHQNATALAYLASPALPPFLTQVRVNQVFARACQNPRALWLADWWMRHFPEEAEVTLQVWFQTARLGTVESLRYLQQHMLLTSEGMRDTAHEALFHGNVKVADWAWKLCEKEGSFPWSTLVKSVNTMSSGLRPPVLQWVQSHMTVPHSYEVQFMAALCRQNSLAEILTVFPVAKYQSPDRLYPITFNVLREALRFRNPDNKIFEWIYSFLDRPNLNNLLNLAKYTREWSVLKFVVSKCRNLSKHDAEVFRNVMSDACHSMDLSKGHALLENTEWMSRVTAKQRTQWWRDWCQDLAASNTFHPEFMSWFVREWARSIQVELPWEHLWRSVLKCHVRDIESGQSEAHFLAQVQWLEAHRPAQPRQNCVLAKLILKKAALRGAMQVVNWCFEYYKPRYSSALLESVFLRLCHNGHLAQAQSFMERFPSVRNLLLKRQGALFRQVCLNGQLDVAQWLYELEPNTLHLLLLNHSVTQKSGKKPPRAMSTWLDQTFPCRRIEPNTNPTSQWSWCAIS